MATPDARLKEMTDCRQCHLSRAIYTCDHCGQVVCWGCINLSTSLCLPCEEISQTTSESNEALSPTTDPEGECDLPESPATLGR